MSAWADQAQGAAAIGTDYVFSHKPNPAVVAEHSWRPELARERYRDVLEKTRGCVVEMILKDISTVRYDPPRLWDWTRIALEEGEKAS